MFSSKSKRRKAALKKAEAEIVSLKDKVKELQESNEQLSNDLVASRQKVDSLKVHDSKDQIDNTLQKDGDSSSMKEEAEDQGLWSPPASKDDKEQSYQLQISELTKKNEELEAKVASLSLLQANQNDCIGEIKSLSVSFDIPDGSKESPAKSINSEKDKEQDGDTIQSTTNGEQLSLESQVKVLTAERDKLTELLTKEKKKSKQRRDAAKERRAKFKDRLSDMNAKLKEGTEDDDDNVGGEDDETAQEEVEPGENDF